MPEAQSSATTTATPIPSSEAETSDADEPATTVTAAQPPSRSTSEALARSTYDGVVGHPVLIGRDHWAGVAATAEGDRGARDYLREHPPVLVECGDLASGVDQDTPDAL